MLFDSGNADYAVRKIITLVGKCKGQTKGQIHMKVIFVTKEVTLQVHWQLSN